MTAEIFGGPFVAPVVAKTLQDLIPDLPSTRMTFGQLTLRAAMGNAAFPAAVWIGRSSNLTTSAKQIGYILAGEPVVIELMGHLSLKQIWVVWNGSDIVYAAGVCY